MSTTFWVKYHAIFMSWCAFWAGVNLVDKAWVSATIQGVCFFIFLAMFLHYLKRLEKSRIKKTINNFDVTIKPRGK